MSKKNAGFTLLEVMIAITIMTVALSAVLTSQSGSIFQTIRAKDMNLAGWLAQRKMVESEQAFEGKPFGEIPKDAEIKRFEEPYEHYSWKREVKEIKFPELTPTGKEGEPVPEPLRILSQSMTKYINTAVRELVITVSWERGVVRASEGSLGDDEANSKVQKIVLSTYLIDMKAEFNLGI